jgi:hypothetical protein
VEAVAVVELVDEEEGAVVVYGHGEVAHFVAAVAVDVADAEAVAVGIGARGGGEAPALADGEGGGGDVVGDEVVRLGHDDERGADAVEEAYADVFGVGGGAEGGGDLEAGA